MSRFFGSGKKIKKVKLKRTIDKQLVFGFGAIFALIGIFVLVSSFAATSVTIDASLPVPQNVKAYGDDRTITVTWDGVGVNQTRVVGYYITYRPKGSSEEFKVRQTEVRRDQWLEYPGAIQLQPLTNGQEYEIYIQSASGTSVTADAGSLVYHGSNTWMVADGKVSNKSAVTLGTPTTARVDAMRSRLTGFFDDFNIAAGPMDETKWNHATNACARAGSAAAFVNDQFHVHNTVGSDAISGSVFCDRAGIASRPRATFDMSTVTEANPGQIEFDIDGASHDRDTWYLDVVPLSARSNRFPLDITSHNDLFDVDKENPGNMLRFNANKGGLTVNYYDANQNPTPLDPFAGTTACQNWLGQNKVEYAACNFGQKTNGLSPTAQPAISAATIPNVRRHWVVQFTPTKIRVFIDSTLVAVSNIPASFFAEKQYTVQSTVFSYNTGKDTTGRVIPSIEMIHWDNFGFNGPKPTEVIYNYLEGGATGTTPTYANGDSNGYRVPSGSRQTIVPIPDTIGNLVNNQARLYYSTVGFTYNYGYWTAGDHILVNGKRYDLPNPSTLMSKVSNPLSANFMVTALTLPINKADLKQGNNTVEFKFADPDISFVNVHIELPYSSTDSARPAYTQPLQVFGTSFYDISQPPFTNCDQYRYVEQDLGLPYQTGKANIVTGGACILLPKGSHHNTGTTPTPTPTDTTKPTVTLTAPTANASFTSGNITFTATATDNIGVNTVEFFVDGVSVGTGGSTGTANTYSFVKPASELTNATHSVYAIAKDAANNNQQSSTVNITVNIPATPPPTGGGGTTTNKFVTLPVNATLPTEASCSALVRIAPEIRPTNANFNATKGTSPNDVTPRVTGNYVGTTDQIIQWAACKWGMDEDVLRAQAVTESYWFQNAGGDVTTDPNSCTPVYPIGTYNGVNNVCPESVGLLQVRWNYHTSAFEDNNAVFSTAYNIDYYGSVWRTCYDGGYGWLNDVEKGATYAAGDSDGCLGVWFAGRWRTAPALEYITNVKSNLTNRVWESTSFKSASAPTQQPTNPNAPAPDTTAPSVSITSPTANQTVSNTITLTANATDTQSAVASVRFYLDGSSVPFSTDITAPFTSSWNSAVVANGSHTVTARATDTAGNIGTSSVITFTVSNTVPDTTKPTTAITSPTNNAALVGTTVVQATATDNVGIARVEFLVDGITKGTDTTSPYSFSWATTTYADGTHTIQTKAFDAANNENVSSIVTVSVDNITDPIPPTAKPGDTNGDGKVDRTDLRILLTNYGTTVTPYTKGDLNGDGQVDRTDLRILLVNYGR